MIWSAGVKALIVEIDSIMDPVSVALLESAYREYEEKQRLNLEVLKTMIQAVCRRIGESKPTEEAKSDVGERLARLEEMIRSLSAPAPTVSQEVIQELTREITREPEPAPKNVFVKEEVRHIHLESKKAPTPAPVPAPVRAAETTTVKHIHVEESAPVIEEEQVIDEEEVVIEEEEVEEEEAEAEEAEDEEELVLEEFPWKGKTYYKDGDDNIYDLNDEGEPEKIGILRSGKILLD